MLAARLFQGSGVTIDKAAAMKWFMRAINTDVKILERLCFRNEAYISVMRALETACSIYPISPFVVAFLKAAELGVCATSCAECQDRALVPSLSGLD